MAGNGKPSLRYNRGRRVLLDARSAHFQRTGHKRIHVGLNYIECEVCKAHAHLDRFARQLLQHGRVGPLYQIQPAEF